MGQISLSDVSQVQDSQQLFLRTKEGGLCVCVRSHTHVGVMALCFTSAVVSCPCSLPILPYPLSIMYSAKGVLSLKADASQCCEI